MSEDQDYLYHYTNISSLAMILKNKNIKFRPLIELDDMEEEIVQDRQRYGKWVFVSSWTDCAAESIPMWRMYTSKSEGVRIKLPKYPFHGYEISPADFEKAVPISEFKYEGKGENIIIPPNEYFSSGYLLINAQQKDILIKVDYTDDHDRLYPQIVAYDGKIREFKLSKLGSHKNTYWAFQNEWRYVLRYFPISVKPFFENENSIKIEVKKILECFDLPFSYYFLKLDEQKFRDMEITLGPQVSDGNRTIVNLLVEKFNPCAQIKDSELMGKIR